MQRSIFALVAFSLIGLGLGSCDGQNQVTIVETSDNVTHPLLHTGETLIFQVPKPIDDKQTYVHFDSHVGQHPCAETTITWHEEHPPQCVIMEKPKATSFYLYLIDQNPNDEDQMAANAGKCPPWCPGTLVVAAANSSPTQSVLRSSAVEVAIYNLNGFPNPALANPGQKVTWFNPGTDSNGGWTVTFDKMICNEGKKIASPGYCTVRTPKRLRRYYKYTITVGTKSGETKSQLYVTPKSK